MIFFPNLYFSLSAGTMSSLAQFAMFQQARASQEANPSKVAEGASGSQATLTSKDPADKGSRFSAPDPTQRLPHGKSPAGVTTSTSGSAGAPVFKTATADVVVVAPQRKRGPPLDDRQPKKIQKRLEINSCRFATDLELWRGSPHRRG